MLIKNVNHFRRHDLADHLGKHTAEGVKNFLHFVNLALVLLIELLKRFDDGVVLTVELIFDLNSHVIEQLALCVHQGSEHNGRFRLHHSLYVAAIDADPAKTLVATE